MTTTFRIIGLIIFCSSLFANAATAPLQSVYDSPSLQLLFDYWANNAEEFHYYEALDQLDLFHQLECQPIETQQLVEPLRPHLPKDKDQLIQNAMRDLQQILGQEDLKVCIQQRHQDGLRLEEIIFESRRNQLALYFAEVED